MPADDSLVLQEQRHLKWRALDPLEQLLMILCGVAITGFCVLVMCDIVTRTIGTPWLWLQEATMTFFITIAPLSWALDIVGAAIALVLANAVNVAVMVVQLVGEHGRVRAKA